MCLGNTESVSFGGKVIPAGRVVSQLAFLPDPPTTTLAFFAHFLPFFAPPIRTETPLFHGAVSDWAPSRTSRENMKMALNDSVF